MDILCWLQNWYHSNCDGGWEHLYGVKIDTLDNPGWSVAIDLEDTEIRTDIDSHIFENSNVTINSTDFTTDIECYEYLDKDVVNKNTH